MRPVTSLSDGWKKKDQLEMTKKYIEVAIERSKPYNHSGHDHTSKKCSQLKRLLILLPCKAVSDTRGERDS
jgi:hypothetical protein